MWRLIADTLRYNRIVVLVAWAIALIVVAMLLLTAWASGRSGAINVGLLGVFLVIASMVAGILAQTTEATERRARLLLTLPLRIEHVAAARAIVPLAILAVGTAVATTLELLAKAAGLAPGRPPGAVVLVACQLGYYMYFATLFPEIARLKRSRDTSLLVAVVAAMVAGFALLLWSQVASSQHGVLAVAYVPGRRALVLLPVFINAALTYVLFLRRRSYVS